MPIKKAKKVAIMPLVVFARNRLEMAGRTSALEPRSRLASRIPGIAIGFRPELKGQRADLRSIGELRLMPSSEVQLTPRTDRFEFDLFTDELSELLRWPQWFQGRSRS